MKVNKKVEKKGDHVIIRTETVFTKSQWKLLKNQTKKNKSLLKKRDKSLSAVQDEWNNSFNEKWKYL